MMWTVSTWMGDRLMDLCTSYPSPRKADLMLIAGVVTCTTSCGIDPMHRTTHALMSPGCKVALEEAPRVAPGRPGGLIFKYELPPGPCIPLGVTP
jgi:hypothetical protein